MDFIINFPLSVKLRVKILLIITDRLNKGIILILILLIFTPAVAIAFMEYYIPYHRFPKVIINNKRASFTNTMWAILYKTLGIKRRLSLIYHPEINRTTERANQVIQPYLCTYTTFSQDN